MRVGFVCEGGLDIKPLEILFSRTLEIYVHQAKLFPIEFKQPYKANGQIITKLDAGVEALMSEDAPDVIILYSDIDKYPTRRNEIRNWVEANQHRSVFLPLVFEPHFEDIFFKEKNALVSVLGLKATESLPHAELQNDPKKRAEAIIADRRRDKFLDISFTKEKIYIKIVESLDLNILDHLVQDYRNFKEEIGRLEF